MATVKPELKLILDRYGINPRDTSQCWDCHGTIVLYHKAFEVIAAKESISFDPPLVLEANGASKSVALCVVARMGERSEWATGEAAPGNNKNSYPFAMAEKRAKDRVVAKLVGLAQYVYSEDEADDFKGGDRKPVEASPAEQAPAQRSPAPVAKAVASEDSHKPVFDIGKEALLMTKTVKEYNGWIDDNAAMLEQLEKAAPKMYADLCAIGEAHLKGLAMKTDLRMAG